MDPWLMIDHDRGRLEAAGEEGEEASVTLSLMRNRPGRFSAYLVVQNSRVREDVQMVRVAMEVAPRQQQPFDVEVKSALYLQWLIQPLVQL